jgi:putative DNA primase/helicase
LNPITIPDELKSIPRWTTWHSVQGKKLPFTKNKTTAISDPTLRLSYLEACAQMNGGGIGFVFDESDDLAGIDLDACLNPETGTLAPWAQKIVDDFKSYTEISPSGTGVKIFAKGAPAKISPNILPMEGETIRGKKPAIEAYTQGRYFTTTGNLFPGSPEEIRNTPEAWLKLANYLKENQTPQATTNRNNKLTSLAGGLRSKGKEFDEILPALLIENQKLIPPLAEKEVESIAKSVCKYPPTTQHSYALTDVGNGERFKARHGKDLLYCYDWKTWLIWDNYRFKTDSDGEIIRRGKETAAAIFDEAKAAFASGNEKAQNIARHAAATQQKGRLESMLWMAQSGLPVKVEELDQNNQLLNLKNGTLDLKTLTLREHRREDKLTKLAPVSLDPEAKCPLWLSFLDRVLDKDVELISFVQRALGYSLTGETSEHVLFLLHGTGANGKSTFIETILSLLGEYARPAEFRTFLASESEKVRNDLAGLVGIRFVSAVEVGDGKQLDEAVIKQITGGDTITTRFLYEEFFDFRPRFKLWLAANSKPEIRGVDEAIWRRVLLIPFEITIPKEERDKELTTKLKAELPGILAWIVDGLRAWQKDGLNPPEKVIAATNEYREEQDFLGPFLDEKFERGEKLFVSNAELNTVYEVWAGRDAVKQRTLARMLKARGFKPDLRKMNGEVKRGWVGLGLRLENQHL